MRAADDYDAIAERQRQLAAEPPDDERKPTSPLAALQLALARRRAIEIERRRIFGDH